MSSAWANQSRSLTSLPRVKLQNSCWSASILTKLPSIQACHSVFELGDLSRGKGGALGVKELRSYLRSLLLGGLFGRKEYNFFFENHKCSTRFLLASAHGEPFGCVCFGISMGIRRISPLFLQTHQE